MYQIGVNVKASGPKLLFMGLEIPPMEWCSSHLTQTNIFKFMGWLIKLHYLKMVLLNPLITVANLTSIKNMKICWRMVGIHRKQFREQERQLTSFPNLYPALDLQLKQVILYGEHNKFQAQTLIWGLHK